MRTTRAPSDLAPDLPCGLLLCGLLLAGCSASDPAPAAEDPGPCDPADRAAWTADCLQPTRSADYYIDQSLAYFDTLDRDANWWSDVVYSELVVRWEWPPWLLLTAIGREHIERTDALLKLYPSTVPERECLFFDTQPFGRCRVVFYYDDHDGQPCPIYEEFTFNDQGEITFIEAWSDLPGMRPMADGDRWAEDPAVDRLATRVLGLGSERGLVDLDGPAVAAAAAEDPDVADLVRRAEDWVGTWSEALNEAGDTLWERGCGF